MNIRDGGERSRGNAEAIHGAQASKHHGAKESGARVDMVRTEERDTKLVAFECEVVGFFIEAADVLGIPKSVAAIYGCCFASAEPLSFADIATRLNISQGSISQGLRVLREMGALKVSAEAPESMLRGVSLGEMKRRDYYTPDLELRKIATHFIEARLEKQLQAGKQRLHQMRAALPTNTDDSARELKARLKQLQNWHEKSRALVPLMKTFLKLG